MASAVNPTSGSSAATSNTSSSPLSTAPSESVFLNLLVAQIQNQDPLNPTDSTQFVSQLAQFSELEQVIGIRSDTDQLAAAATSTSASTNPAASSSNTNTGNTNTGNSTTSSNLSTGG